MEGNDMITNLYRLPKLEDRKDTIQIKRAFAGDKGAIFNLYQEQFFQIVGYMKQSMPLCRRCQSVLLR